MKEIDRQAYRSNGLSRKCISCKFKCRNIDLCSTCGQSFIEGFKKGAKYALASQWKECKDKCPRKDRPSKGWNIIRIKVIQDGEMRVDYKLAYWNKEWLDDNLEYLTQVSWYRITHFLSMPKIGGHHE